MAYFDVPRLHFWGKFLADPSTIDNNANDFQPNAPLSNDPNSDYFVGWNPQGSHTFGFADCVVRSVVNAHGQIQTAGAGDPLVGASVQSVLTHHKYPAKLVDLDVDRGRPFHALCSLGRAFSPGPVADDRGLGDVWRNSR